MDKLKKIISKKDFTSLKLLIFFNTLIFFLETLSIIAIPIFITALVDPILIQEKFSNIFLLNYLSLIDKKDLIMIISLSMLGIFFLKNFLLLLFIIKQNKFLEKIKIKLSLKLFNHYLTMPFLNHLKKNPADLTRNITQHCSAMAVYITHLNTFIREITAAVMITLLVVWASPKIIIAILLGFTTLMFFYMNIIKPKIDLRSNNNNRIARDFIKTINEIFGSIRDLKVHMKEQEVYDQLKNNILTFEKNVFFFQTFEKIPRLFIELVSISTLTIVAIYLIEGNQNYQYYLPMLSLLTISIFRLIPAFVSINNAKYYMTILKPSLNTLSSSVEEIDNSKIELENDLQINSPEFLPDLKNEYISIKNLSFSYPGNETKPIDNINFEIKKREVVGITGETGAGKSTLFYLMLGLVLPTNGSIHHYGKNISFDINNWRKKIGYISQNIFLFDTTIEKNITFDFFRETVDEKKLEKALEVAQLKKKIKDLPGGVKTIVGNNGVKLSGGERQRIAISRALYQNPEILFLDESTSALDHITEKLLMKQIKSQFKDKTIILIAHRRSLLNYCDKILELDNGKLKEIKQI